MNHVSFFEFLFDQPEEAVHFFRRLFGWEPSPFEGAPHPYFLVAPPLSGSGIGGALGQVWGRQKVINTIEVEDLEAKRDKVEELGGTLVTDVIEIPNVGRHCYASGPDGLIFGMMEPKK